MRASIYSVYMPNISSTVVRAQKECVTRFLPKDWSFFQVCGTKSHGELLRKCVEENKDEYTIFLDVDCVPLSPVSFSYFFTSRWSIASGALMGAAQRANHLRNDKHIYVGPFCMAFKNSVYWEVGGPTFGDTLRGDTGEELTYAWQEKGKPVIYIYPSDVERPLWDLIEGVQFGIGTTYENLFYHAFCIRAGAEPQELFLKKCKEVVEIYDYNFKEREQEQSLVK